MLAETHQKEIDALLVRFADRRSAVLPLLYIAQDTYGELTPAVIREVAEALDVPYTAVFEVVGFYTLFYDHPIGKWMVQVCDDVPCCYVGAEELIAALKQQFNIREEQVSDDGMFLLQRVKCLAACDRAPVVQANLSYFYDVTAERADALIRYLREHADGAQAASISGHNAEDFEPDGNGGFRLIERRLGAVAAAGQSATPPEPEKQAEEEAASVPAEPAQAAAEAEAEAASPVEPSPDQTSASAHPRSEAQDDETALPPRPAQQQPPTETSADTSDTEDSNKTDDTKQS